MESTPPTIPPPPPPPPSSSFLRHLINFDTSLSLLLYTITQPILPYSLLKSLEISGDGRLFFPLILSLLLYPLSTAGVAANPLLLNLLLGALLDILLIGLLKHLIRRPRPVYNKNMFLSFAVDHWSFPSGHSSRVSLIATLFYVYSDWVRTLLISSRFHHQFLVDNVVSVVASWAVITSVSRVLLGRHFVLDVFAGMFLGVLEGIFTFRVFNYGNLSSFLR